jgi:hypothetical protein
MNTTVLAGMAALGALFLTATCAHRNSQALHTESSDGNDTPYAAQVMDDSQFMPDMF